MKKPDISNKGFTLAEVMIAIAIASIVLTMLATMIFTTLNLFGRNNANVEMQNELQIVMNTVLDNVMEAQGLILLLPDDVAAPMDPPDSTPVIFLGEAQVVESGGNWQIQYNGTTLIYLEAEQELYLIDPFFPTLANTDYPLLNINDYSSKDAAINALNANLPALVESIALDFAGWPANDRLPWLLGRNISRFRVVPAGDPARLLANDGVLWRETTNYIDGTSAHRYYFAEPFNLSIEIEVEVPSNNNMVSRVLINEAAIRNRLEVAYIHDPVSGRGMIEYRGR